MPKSKNICEGYLRWFDFGCHGYRMATEWRTPLWHTTQNAPFFLFHFNWSVINMCVINKWTTEGTIKMNGNNVTDGRATTTTKIIAVIFMLFDYSGSVHPILVPIIAFCTILFFCSKNKWTHTAWTGRDIEINVWEFVLPNNLLIDCRNILSFVRFSCCN